MSTLEILSIKRDAFVFQFEYTNDERMEYFKQKIDENTGPEDYKTNVKGKMTKYDFFQKDPSFTDFINKEFFILEISKFSQIFPGSNLMGEMTIGNAWGSKLEKGNEVVPHAHLPYHWSSVLYFCDSAPLETEIGMLKTSKGKVITIPGWLKHWVQPVNNERYNLVWNWDYSLKYPRDGKFNE